jgi:hypothetical protein
MNQAGSKAATSSASFDHAGLFKIFVPNCVANSTSQPAEGLILLIDKLCRKGWTNGFAFFMRELPGIFGRGGTITQKALVAALALAALPQAKRVFQEVDAVSPLKAAHVDPGHEKYRETFLKYLGDV